jgi:hypothetical protein
MPLRDTRKQWMSNHRLLACLDDCERRIFTSLDQAVHSITDQSASF